MTTLLKPFRRMFSPIHPIPAGIYHYISPPDDPRNYRLHLRLEEDGSGVLIVNASTILHLNQTAAEYGYYLVQNTLAQDVARKMVSRYNIGFDQALKDYSDFTERIQTLVEMPDLDPVTYLGFERQTPFTGRISAPYRLDCALTYRLPEGQDQAAAPSDRSRRELTTDEWKAVLDKVWLAGIPHVVFTGGEPTLRPDLPDLVQHTETLGLVSGLLSDGMSLADESYLNRLLQTGLDHLMVVLQPEVEASWSALEKTLAADLFVAVHLTLTPQNQAGFLELIDQVARRGVKAVSLSAASLDLAEALEAARRQVAYLSMELVWNMPVPYSALNPVSLERKGGQPEGYGRAWLYVEPDGDVLPAQGVEQVLGNLLTDPWEKIWQR